MDGIENRTFRAIARRLTNYGLQRTVLSASESPVSIDLQKELKILSQCVEKANDLISSPDDSDKDMAGIINTRQILRQHGLNYIPSPFTTADNPQSWLRSLLKTIKVGNVETGTTYRVPEKIKMGINLVFFSGTFMMGLGA